VSITQQKEGDAKNAMMAAFAGHASLKQVIVVDDDVDPFDDQAVQWALATRFQADRDIMVIEGARGSSLDPSADGTTAKLGMDATAPAGRDRSAFELIS
jgi:UbiD family decarboxylase